MTITGLACVACGAPVGVESAAPWQCPNRTPDDPYHVLQLVDDGAMALPSDEPNPFVRYGPRLAWWAFAAAHGMSDSALVELTREVADGFVTTPFGRSDVLSDAVGTNVWVKDETGQVAGSHKARHLVSILLHLLAAEQLGLVRERPRLAIASCGNAAMAAATLAARVDWPIDVYVPTWMDDAFGRILDDLGATTHRCERRRDDPPGDPAMLRFRDAVADGSIPFSVQGPENALCLDGGRTIGWEIADQALQAGVALDRAMVHVGGGAFAACVGAGLGPEIRLDTVQAAGCAPLAAAWERARHVDKVIPAWPEVMRPWPNPTSAADGILDDETYDWVADFIVMRSSGGQPYVATERQILRAHGLATEAGYCASVTGSAGVAGLLAIADQLAPDDNVVVVMSGVDRT